MRNIIRIDAWDMRHGKHFTGIWVKDHCKTGGGLDSFNPFFQFVLNNGLIADVNCQPN